MTFSILDLRKNHPKTQFFQCLIFDRNFYLFGHKVFFPALLRNEKSGDEKITKIECKLTEDRSFEIFGPPISCIAIHDIWA